MQILSIQFFRRGIAAGASLLATTALMAIFAAPVHAAGADDVRTLAVDYSDLNLETDTGNRRLYWRLRAAAERVCEQRASRDLQARSAEQSCRREAIARAVKEIGSPRLVALHASRSAS